MFQKTFNKTTTAIILFFAFSPIGKAAIFQGSTDSTVTDTASGVKVVKTALQGSGVTGTEDISDLILKYVNFSLPFLALAAFIGFVYAGFLYVTAYGVEEQTGKAKKIFIYSILGLVVVILSYSIVQLLTKDLVTGIQTTTK